MSSRALMAAGMGLREQTRRPVFLASLVVLPLWFIARSIAVTEPVPRRIGVPGDNTIATTMREIHGADMALIAVGFLVGLCGVFLMLSAREADRRLVVAGFHPREVIGARLLVLLCAMSVVVSVSLAVTAWKFEVQNWPAFAAATALIGLEFSSTFHAEAELVMAVVWTVALLLSVVVAMRRSLGASG